MYGDNNNKFKDEVQPDISLHLGDEEKIIWQIKPDKSAVKSALIYKGLPFALIWTAFDALMLFFIINGFLLPSSGISMMLVFLTIGFFAVHMLPVWMWLRNVFTYEKKYRNSDYTLTDKRVIIRNATAKYKFREVHLEDIKEVSESTKRNGIGCIFIYANMQVYSMPHLKNAAQIKENIIEYVAAARKNAEDEEEEQEEREEVFDGYAPLADERKYDAPNSNPYPVQEEQSEEDRLKEQFEELFSDDED